MNKKIHKEKKVGKLARSFLSLLLIFAFCLDCLPVALAATVPTATVENAQLKAQMENRGGNGYLYILSVPQGFAQSDGTISFSLSCPEGFDTKEYPPASIIPKGATFDYGDVTYNFNEDKKGFTFSLKDVPISPDPTIVDETLPNNDNFAAWKDIQFYWINATLANDNYTYVDILVYEESSEVNKTALLANLEAVPTTGYYTENDRYNGKTASTNGFWAEMQSVVSAAQAIYDNENVGQQAVDTAAANLNQTDPNSAISLAIANLIPITQANTTVLYEQLHTKNYWNTDGKLVQNPPYMQTGYVVPSADNCTASTWSAYAAAKAEGQALMDSLFDKEGNATAENTADKQREVERLAAAADPHTLVNAERYNKAYQTYRSRKTEVNSLLSVYAPEKMNASDYTEASWQTYIAAYDALKQDMEHTIVGGTRADMEMLEGFTGHIDALKTARKGLVSGVGITVSFRYVNNFAAKYSKNGQSGTAVYENSTLSLSAGSTSVADAITASGIDFDKSNVNLPCDNYNLSDINPMIAVYINGESYGLAHTSGGDLEDIQLHKGDKVRLARVCTPTVKIEASSGYDSTQIFEYLAKTKRTTRTTTP